MISCFFVLFVCFVVHQLFPGMFSPFHLGRPVQLSAKKRQLHAQRRRIPLALFQDRLKMF